MDWKRGGQDDPLLSSCFSQSDLVLPSTGIGGEQKGGGKGHSTERERNLDSDVY